ncbi:hypothetical protein P3X46_007320 [Hevea brasiliensis]|uniref:Retrotransposon gag domain-containing protein n=1 Tax=Hevea brasiliensis TaxID=3981 RepID=A0ABQ9MX96_HEVBR|nr:hypothetical protein P3X46_007320 [Hevea brasiliensis]
MNANNFELKPAWLQRIQQTQFGGSPTEDPYYHLQCFLALCDTFKMNGVSDQAIRLRVFPFSLRDRARKWLLSQPARTFTTWEDFSQAFLARYFPPVKTVRLRVELKTFRQKEGESLYDKTMDQALELLERVAYHNYEWSNERENTRTTAGILKVDALSMINAQFDQLTRRLNRMQANAIGMNNQHYDSYGEGYMTSECNNFNELSIKQMNYVNYRENFNQRQLNNSYSNTYNPG